MLSLQLKSGGYLTIGDDIVVQVFEASGGTFRVAVKAPRELPVLRGEVLERTDDRPDGLRGHRPQSAAERARNARRKDQLAARKTYFEDKKRESRAEKDRFMADMRALLDRAGQQGGAGELAAMRARLDEFAAAETVL